MAETELPPMFAEDLAQMRAGDVEGMLANYHPDVRILRLPNIVANGKDEARAFLEDYVALKPTIVEVISIDQSDDIILYHSTINVGGNDLDLVGTWVLRDGLIWRQTAVIAPAHAEAR